MQGFNEILKPKDAFFSSNYKVMITNKLHGKSILLACLEYSMATMRWDVSFTRLIRAIGSL